MIELNLTLEDCKTILGSIKDKSLVRKIRKQMLGVPCCLGDPQSFIFERDDRKCDECGWRNRCKRQIENKM